jgi:hypothetical protein
VNHLHILGRAVVKLGLRDVAVTLVFLLWTLPSAFTIVHETFVAAIPAGAVAVGDAPALWR